MKNLINNHFCLKRNLSILLSALFSYLFLSCWTAKAQDYQIEAGFVANPPELDGNLEDSAWQIATQSVLKENSTGNQVQDPALVTYVMTCYDANNLYIAFLCQDPDIWSTFTQRDEYLWKEEAVEVFIDVDDIPENYVEIEVSPANVLFDSYIVDPDNIDVPATAMLNLSGIRTAVHVNGSLNKRGDSDKNWSVEIAIPFKDLITERTKEITLETEIKINFYRLDHNRGSERGAYAWSPTGGGFHKPSVFGRLILK